MFGGAIANQGGFQLNLSPTANNGGIDGTALTNASPAPVPQSRNANALLIENTLTWLKGTHNLSMGASWTAVRPVGQELESRAAARLRRGHGGSGTGLFTGAIGAAAFPGASATNLHGRAEPLRAPHRTREHRRW